MWWLGHFMAKWQQTLVVEESNTLPNKMVMQKHIVNNQDITKNNDVLVLEEEEEICIKRKENGKEPQWYEGASSSTCCNSQKTMQGSKVHFNTRNQSLLLDFDNNGKVTMPLDKQPWKFNDAWENRDLWLTNIINAFVVFKWLFWGYAKHTYTMGTWSR